MTKVVWLCQFSNKEIQDYLKISGIDESAQWITNLIRIFQNSKLINLTIVSPNIYTNKDIHFLLNGINYYFYKRIPIPSNYLILRKIHTALRIETVTNFFWVKHKVTKIVKRINPDIIHVHGTENPQYSASALSLIDRFPILLTIQGFIKQSTVKNYSIRNKIKIEHELIQKCIHFGTRTEDMNRYILKINPNAVLHYHSYPIDTPSDFKKNIGCLEPIDCLFFARVCKDKGIEDLLKAISLIKKQIPEISLMVIGRGDAHYLSYLKVLIRKLDIENNVKFAGFLPSQKDIFKYAEISKVCVLPTYHDIISGTIIESMFMKLPVIAYSVGGIPEININRENVKLVEKYDIISLADTIVGLINSTSLRRNLAENAYEFANENFNNQSVESDIIKAYNYIINEKLR